MNLDRICAWCGRPIVEGEGEFHSALGLAHRGDCFDELAAGVQLPRGDAAAADDQPARGEAPPR